MSTPKNQQTAVNKWNRQHAIGTPVIVTLDDGTTRQTTTTSDAWLLGGHSAVIKLNSISGCYMLSRVEANSAQ